MIEDLAEKLHEDRERLKRELNAAHQISKKYEDRYFECLDRIKRLEDIINRAANRFFADGADGQTAAEMLKILEEVREAKP